MGLEAPLELAEFLAVAAQAGRDAQEARERLQRALERETATASVWARSEAQRAKAALARADLRRLVIQAVWDSGGREREVVPARFERVHVRRDGVALVRVQAKRGRWRTLAFSPPTWADISAWHVEHGDPPGRVPIAGPIFPGSRPGESLSPDAAERAVHEIATRAGVQRVADPAKRSHRYHVTLKAIRELSEAHVVYDLGFNAKLAARVHDHSDAVQDRHYLRGRVDAAARMALARAHVHG